MDTSIKTALVIGAGGFIGSNLVRRLKSEGWHVTGVDLKYPEFAESPANVFLIRDASVAQFIDTYYDRIYQLAADMGGAGFVFTGENDANIMTNSAGININVLRQVQVVGCGAIFYSSSVCVYPDGVEGREEQAWPAHPPSNYGVEKLFSENLYLSYAKNYGLNVKIARFHNTFGPNGCFEGGREKSPAAICRKVVQSDGTIELWGDGEQVRPFIYIDDLLDGIEALMQSDFSGPVNLGPSEGITINQLVDIVEQWSGKTLERKYIPGPTGEKVRHANNNLAKEKLGWEPKCPLGGSLIATYEWIKSRL